MWYNRADVGGACLAWEGRVVVAAREGRAATYGGGSCSNKAEGPAEYVERAIEEQALAGQRLARRLDRGGGEQLLMRDRGSSYCGAVTDPAHGATQRLTADRAMISVDAAVKPHCTGCTQNGI